MSFHRAIPGNKEVTLLTWREDWPRGLVEAGLGSVGCVVTHVPLCPATISGQPYLMPEIRIELVMCLPSALLEPSVLSFGFLSQSLYFLIHLG